MERIIQYCNENLVKDRKKAENLVSKFYPLSKHKLERLQKMLHLIQEEKYPRKKKRLLGTQSKAAPEYVFMDLLHYFAKNDKIRLAIEYEAIQGVRIGDVVKLNMRDIDFTSNHIRVYNNKADRWYDTPMSRMFEIHLKNYIEKYKNYIEECEGYIFFSNKSKRRMHLSSDGLRNTIYRALKEIGHHRTYAVSKDGRQLHKYSSHSLRGHACTRILKHGNNDSMAASELLNHSDLGCLKFYVEDSFKNIARIMRL